MTVVNKSKLADPWVIGIIVVFVTTGLYIQSLPPEQTKDLTSETGPFEILSAASYGIAFLIAGAQLFRDRSWLRVATAVMTLWATLREADFQKRFTYRSVESLGYYTNMVKAPWSQKFVVVLVLAPFGIAGLYLVWQYFKRLPGAWRDAERWLSLTFGIILLMGTSSFLEKILLFGAAEEVCELGVALMVVMLVWVTRVKINAPASN